MRISLLATLLFLTSVAVRADILRVFDIPIHGQIAEVPVKLHAQRDAHVLELRSTSFEGGPAYMYLLDAAGNQLAAQTITTGYKISVPGNTVGTFTLVLRAANPGIYTGDLWVDDLLHTAQVSFAHGDPLGLPTFIGEELTAISPPAGGGPHAVYLLSADGLQIQKRARGPVTTMPITSGFVVYAGTNARANGRVVVYRNDRAHDSDADGLGDQLERVLGTCAQPIIDEVVSVNCEDAVDARDTDGDGLWDGWEVLGKTYVVNGISQVVPLPTWGSNPRHKDIFIEADFGRLMLQDNQSGLASHMTPSIARKLAGVYGDAATTDPAIRSEHAQTLGNPDGQPGISLHIDTGIPPETAADAAIYGDWGGYTAVDAVPDGMGAYRRQNPYEAMVNNMSDSRRGLFHYVLGYMSGGGACGVGIACGFNMASVSNSAHEFGHTLFLDHSGPAGKHEPNCKPNYPSLMNYAFPSLELFSDGRGSTTLNNHALIETGVAAGQPDFLEVLRSSYDYRVDAVTGSVDWNRDGVFQSSNVPVRAYGNLQPNAGGGGCEFTREGEVQVGTMSRRSPAIFSLNGVMGIFTVTLDNKLKFSAMSAPWTCQDVDKCPAPSFPNHVLSNLGLVDGVDAATINVNGTWKVIAVGIRPDGTIFETSLSMAGGQFVFGGYSTIPAAPAAGEPSLAVTRDGKKVVLAYKGVDSILRYRTRGSGGWGPESQVRIGNVPLVMASVSSPGIAFTRLPLGLVSNQESLVGAFTTSDGWMKLYTLGGFPTAGWARLPIQHGLFPISVGRPALAWTESYAPADGNTQTNPKPVSVGRFYLAFPSAESDFGTTPGVVRWAMSYVDNNGKLQIGLYSFFDNVWSFAFGLDFLQPGEIGLRAAEVYAIPNVNSQLVFRPHADGISDLPYKNYSDWPVLAWGTCRVLADSQPPAIRTECGFRPW